MAKCDGRSKHVRLAADPLCRLPLEPAQGRRQDRPKWKMLWLLMEARTEAAAFTKYWLLNLPKGILRRNLVWLAALRPQTEHSCERLRQELESGR